MMEQDEGSCQEQENLDDSCKLDHGRVQSRS